MNFSTFHNLFLKKDSQIPIPWRQTKMFKILTTTKNLTVFSTKSY